MSFRDILPGESLIPTIERDSPELSGWGKSIRETEWQRCHLCSKIKLDELSQTYVEPDGVSRGRKHHRSWAELKASATAGCTLCRLFYFVKHESDKQSKRIFADGQLYIKLSGPTLELGSSSIYTLNFRLSLGKDRPREKFSYDRKSPYISSRLIEDNPASSEAFARAQHWIDICKANHQYCLSNENVPLPTRVLDVQASDESKTVQVHHTEPLLGRGQNSKRRAAPVLYAQPSFRIRTSTVETLEDLKNGISVSRLPKTYQDAITVTRSLGIRYLWIDSLCIQQDSPEDWGRESAIMSEVYGNSFLSILASSADNSEMGFLNLRDPDRCLLTKLCPYPEHPDHWVWIRWPPSEGRWDHSDRKIGQRGWAFQELSLPPRVLEYAPTEMEWHCNQISSEERIIDFEAHIVYNVYKELMWILGQPDIDNCANTSEGIPEHPAFCGSSDKPITIYNRWYQLVEGYSGRQLTFETDKLPAIAGLARKIQNISGDTYMAGLWKRDLGAGLCWQARGYGDLQQPAKYICPSWSWASLKGCITHNIPDGHLLAAELLEYNMKTDPNNPLGEVFSGSIALLAPIRPLKISQGTVRAEYVELDSQISDWTRRLENDGGQVKSELEHLYALRDQVDVVDPRGTGICSVCFDLSPPEGVDDVQLLQLLAPEFQPVPKKYGDSFRPYGIVLKKAADNEDVYQRIGVYSVVDAEAPFIGPEDECSALKGWKKTTVTII